MAVILFLLGVELGYAPGSHRRAPAARGSPPATAPLAIHRAKACRRCGALCANAPMGATGIIDRSMDNDTLQKNMLTREASHGCIRMQSRKKIWLSRGADMDMTIYPDRGSNVYDGVRWEGAQTNHRTSGQLAPKEDQRRAEKMVDSSQFSARLRIHNCAHYDGRRDRSLRALGRKVPPPRKGPEPSTCRHCFAGNKTQEQPLQICQRVQERGVQLIKLMATTWRSRSCASCRKRN